ncbi:HtaA domain-containing protein [Streptomyces luteireticuli]|uniref:HtaA domain-containing protein n=1 Tax=Streptomyces luteireticuli TaxID=173858 RepID=UPI0035565BEF
MAVSHRPLALAAAVATAAALGATVLTLPAHAVAGTGEDPAAAAKPPAKFELKDGTLTWGVKESFRNYVTGPISGGKVQVADGAKQAKGNGAFTFSGGKGTYDLSQHAVSTTFKGSVRFLGHAKKGGGWELDLKFADLKLVTKGKTGRITADVTSYGKTRNDVTVASLDLSKVTPGRGTGGAMTFPKIPAKLTADGAKAFAYHGSSFYKAGDGLDPATLSVKQGKAIPAPQPKPQPKPKSTVTAPKPASVPGKPEAATDESLLPRNPDPKPSEGAPQQADGTAPKSGELNTAATSGDIADGRLTWGVKESFRKYVTGSIANGRILPTGGTEKAGDSYNFTKGHGKFDSTAPSLDAAFNGTLQFIGHENEGKDKLDLKLTNLRIKGSGSGGELIADVSSNQRGKGGTYYNANGVTVAKLKLTADSLKPKGGLVTINAAAATLTADGAKAFSGFYKEGAALDPVSAVVSTDKDVKLPAFGDGSSASDPTGSSSTSTDGTGTTGTGDSTTGAAKGGVTGTEDTLAHTGADTPTGPLAGSAAALVLAGGAAVWGARRKSAATGR